MGLKLASCPQDGAVWIVKRPFCTKLMGFHPFVPRFAPHFALVHCCSIFCVRRHLVETESTQLWAIHASRAVKSRPSVPNRVVPVVRRV